jgi:RimJ/RimL family protein N-acetyltransferase
MEHDMTQTNLLGQPIGDPLPNWTPRPLPPRTPMQGRTCRLEVLDAARHAADLHAANMEDADGRIWTYMGYGPFDSEEDYRAWIAKDVSGNDPLFHAIIDAATDKAIGVASYLRISPDIGSIEVGHINYAPALQRTVAATEAMYMMMARAFDELGYRRYEWKCDNANEKSRNAAARLGFTFEGVFRQCTIYKGRNRDTAWFSIIDSEWPQIKAAFEAYLDLSNFDAAGKQKRSLSAFRHSRE